MAVRYAKSALAALGASALMAVTTVHAASAGAPVTRYVDADGHAGPAGCSAPPSAFRKVQAAITASSDGDTVIVCPGVYRENLTIGVDALKIRGASVGTAKIRAPQVGGTAPLVDIPVVQGIRITGLVFQAPTSEPCRRVSALMSVRSGASVTLIRDRFEAIGPNTIGPCGYRIGIDVVEASSLTADELTVRDFRLYGVYLTGAGASGLVEDSTIHFSHAGEVGNVPDLASVGLGGEDGASMTFRRNTIRSLKTGGRSTPLLESGISTYAVDDPILRRNDVGWVQWAISVFAQGGAIHHNTVHHGRRLTATEEFRPIGIWLGGESITVGSNEARGFGNGIRAEGPGDHSIHDNDFRGNRANDCLDITSGGGTAGTANTWTSNLGVTDSPDGICSPS